MNPDTAANLQYSQNNHLLLSDTKLSKNDIQHIFNIDAAGYSTESAGRGAKIFGGEFGKARLGKTVERRATDLQRLAVARPGDGRGRARGKAPGDLGAKPLQQRLH